MNNNKIIRPFLLFIDLKFHSGYNCLHFVGGAGMDRRLDLCAGRHYSQTSLSQAESLHNFTNSERHALRKSAARSIVCKFRLQIMRRFQRTRTKPANFVQLLTGQ
jgi:hypothetical protein